MIELFDNFYSTNALTESPCKNNVPKPEEKPEQKPDDNDVILINCNSYLIKTIGLATAYVPYQEKSVIMDSEKSLACGTVFPDLVMPYQKRSYRRGME